MELKIGLIIIIWCIVTSEINQEDWIYWLSIAHDYSANVP